MPTVDIRLPFALDGAVVETHNVSGEMTAAAEARLRNARAGPLIEVAASCLCDIILRLGLKGGVRFEGELRFAGRTFRLGLAEEAPAAPPVDLVSGG